MGIVSNGNSAAVLVPAGQVLYLSGGAGSLQEVNPNGQPNLSPLNGSQQQVGASPIARSFIVTAATGQTVTYNYAPSLSNGALPLVKWQAAKLRGPAAPPRIVMGGDSHVAGEGGGLSTTNALGLDGAQPYSWAARLAALIGAETAQFFGDGNAAQGAVTPASYDPRLTLAGNWAVGAGAATLGGRLFVASTTSGGDLTFTPGTPWDTADVYLVTNTNGTTALRIKVNGATVQTVNTLSSAEGLIKVTVTTALGLNTLSFDTNATNTGIVVGAVCRNSLTTKPLAYIGGNCGQVTSYFALSNHAWSFRPCITAIDPDLFIFAATINDGKAGTTKAAYKANVLQVISAAPNADIVLLVAFPSSNASSTNGLVDSYRDALLEIAATTPNCRVIDCRNVFGWSSAQATLYGYLFDGDHANAAGYLAQANYLYQTLLPAGL